MRFDKNEKLKLYLTKKKNFKLFYYLVYFLLLFMDPTALFSTIYEFYCIISTNFTFIYSIFNNKFLISAK